MEIWKAENACRGKHAHPCRDAKNDFLQEIHLGRTRSVHDKISDDDGTIAIRDKFPNDRRDGCVTI